MDTSVCSSGGRLVKSAIDAASGKVAWAGGSVRPGISVAPPPWITSTPSRGGVPPGGATAAIRLPSTSTSPRNGSPPLPSRTLTFVIRSTLTAPASPDAGAVLAFDHHGAGRRLDRRQRRHGHSGGTAPIRQQPCARRRDRGDRVHVGDRLTCAARPDPGRLAWSR